VIEGPDSGEAGESQVYTTWSHDADSYGVRITFDWDDGTSVTGDLVNPGEAVQLNHVWRKAGIYSVRARAVDVEGAESVWSPIHRVTIADPSATPPPASSPPSLLGLGVLTWSIVAFAAALIAGAAVAGLVVRARRRRATTGVIWTPPGWQ
jgi:hypothetical protein